VIFFYEILFVVVTLGAVLVGEVWSRLAAVLLLGAFLLISMLGVASFDARLATPEGQTMSDDERRFFVDARDGLKHLRLLFGLATAAALVWRLIAG
jgi:hypothetical protein